MATPAIAANAYASLARMTDPGAGIAKAIGGGGEQGSPSFGSMLKDAIGAVAESGRKSDAATQSMAVGKANIVDVVTAVAETEVAVNTLVSVRDKVVAAYEEIMRMPI